MSENKFYPTWKYWSESQEVPTDCDVVFTDVTVGVSNFDNSIRVPVKEISMAITEAQADNRKFAAIILSKDSVSVHETPVLQLEVHQAVKDFIVNEGVEYVGVADIFDSEGRLYRDSKTLGVIGEAGFYSILATMAIATFGDKPGKVFYKIDAHTLQANHISKIHSMKRDSMIDTLVVKGKLDENAHKVLRALEYAGLEIAVIED